MPERLEILQNWANSCRENPEFSIRLETLLLVSLLEIWKKKYPLQGQISKETAFSSVLSLFGDQSGEVSDEKVGEFLPKNNVYGSENRIKSSIESQNGIKNGISTENFGKKLSLWRQFPTQFEKEILRFAADLPDFLPEKSPLETFPFDLRNIPCPECSMRARVLFSGIPEGVSAFLNLDCGSPAENVPASLVADGLIIEKREKKEGFWQFLIRKPIKEK